jgi:hypothetical protein
MSLVKRRCRTLSVRGPKPSLLCAFPPRSSGRRGTATVGVCEATPPSRDLCHVILGVLVLARTFVPRLCTWRGHACRPTAYLRLGVEFTVNLPCFGTFLPKVRFSDGNLQCQASKSGSDLNLTGNPVNMSFCADLRISQNYLRSTFSVT